MPFELNHKNHYSVWYYLMKSLKKSLTTVLILGFAAVFTGLINAKEYREDELPYVEIAEVRDLAALGHEANQKNKVIMLEMSASYCGYCRTLEEEIIKPMLRSGDYNQHVLIRKMEIDSHYNLNMQNGEKSSPAQLAQKYNVYVTPTLLFLDGNGKEISERILGVNSLDYYGYYVDEALKQGQLNLKKN